MFVNRGKSRRTVSRRAGWSYTLATQLLGIMLEITGIFRRNQGRNLKAAIY
jgi:hypothetical protein